MTRLLLVRHGETGWNERWRYQGQLDVPLSEEGVHQAHRLGRRLAAEPLAALYTSDLARALRTAEIIGAGRGLPISPRPELRELGFGLFEGLTREEAASQYGEEFWRWYGDPYRKRPPGGETFEELTLRVRPLLAEIRELYPEASVLVIAHAGSLKALLYLCLPLRPESYGRLYLHNASLSVLEVSPSRAILRSWNDLCHLREAP